MWNLALVHLETVLVSEQDRRWFAPNIPSAQKSIWTRLMELLGDEGHVESHFNPFGDSVSVGAR
jgi:hypothetical protein